MKFIFTSMSLAFGLLAINQSFAHTYLPEEVLKEWVKREEERALEKKKKCEQILRASENGYSQDIFVSSASCIENNEVNLKMLKSGLVDKNEKGLDLEGKSNYALEAAIVNPIFFKQLITAGADANRLSLFDRIDYYGKYERVNLIDVSQLTDETIEQLLLLSKSHIHYQYLLDYPEFVIKLLNTLPKPKEAALDMLSVLFANYKYDSIRMIKRKFEIGVNDIITIKNSKATAVPLWAYFYIEYSNSGVPHTSPSYKLHEEFMGQDVIFDKDTVELAVQEMVEGYAYAPGGNDARPLMFEEIKFLVSKGGDFSESIDYIEQRIVELKIDIEETDSEYVRSVVTKRVLDLEELLDLIKHRGLERK